jgi:[acyl-carrier-protein] S-malonyltransferase
LGYRINQDDIKKWVNLGNQKMTEQTKHKSAWVFPGQGSQSVGMLGTLTEKSTKIQDTFAEASDYLGYDLWTLTQEGPAESLNQTVHTQPALLTAGVALWRTYSDRRTGTHAPVFLAGHSLGEYTALVCAGALDFKDAIMLVAERGRLMQRAVPEGIGAMAAILGLSDADVLTVCKESAEGEIVSPANYNTIGQVVIAGHKAAVMRAIEKAKSIGAKRAILLPVSVPSHCALMKPAAEEFSIYLDSVQFKTPLIRVLHNVDACSHENPADIRHALSLQLYMPVRWVKIIQTFFQDGISCLIECGPGNVLTGLNKRIVPMLTCVSVSSEEAICL